MTNRGIGGFFPHCALAETSENTGRQATRDKVTARRVPTVATSITAAIPPRPIPMPIPGRILARTALAIGP